MGKNTWVTHQDLQQFTVHSLLPHCLCECWNKGAPITAVSCMRQGSLCVCTWFIIHSKLQSSHLHVSSVTLWASASLTSDVRLADETNGCNEMLSYATLHLSWREVDCWNCPTKSSDAREAFKPLPVCWLVYRKSHGGCILQRMALCSDWAACVNRAVNYNQCGYLNRLLLLLYS